MRTPPRLAKALLRRCIPEGLSRGSALGDLEEAYLERVKLRTDRYAAAWYWLQSSRLGVRYLVERTVNRHLYAPPPEGKPSRKNLLESITQDLHFAVRTLRRRPLFATVAVLTLGLGIGAATAMFTVIDGVLLKPLPYEEPRRLVAIWQTWPDAEGRPGNEGLRWNRYTLTYSQYRDLSENRAGTSSPRSRLPRARGTTHSPASPNRPSSCPVGRRCRSLWAGAVARKCT